MSLLSFLCTTRVVALRSHHLSHLHLHLLPNSSSSSFQFRLISSISNSNFTVDYLTNSCGLSPESALKASKSVQLKSPTRPDSVISLFNAFDIPKPQISKLITLRPGLLLADPNKNLKPKLEILFHIGLSGSVLGKFLSCNANYLLSSLENQITPAINFLKGFVHTDCNLVKVLSRMRWMSNAECQMGPNITLLRHHGVTEFDISKLMIWYPRSLFVKPDQFNKVVFELNKMGVTHSDGMFLHCLRVLLSVSKPTWDAKLAVYKSFGWSEDEVLSMFKRQPYTMLISEKKMRLFLNFVTNDLNWTRADVSRNPTVLTLSLEKRVIPRSYVLQILLSKGLINNVSIGSALTMTKNRFMEKFIIKYRHQVPEILKFYAAKMGTQDERLLIGSEDE